MPRVRNIPLTRTRGKTLELSGVARKRGRATSLIGHILRFAIADSSTMSRVVTVQTGSGITQDETGRWHVTVPATSMRKNNFPNAEYSYELEIQEDGDPDKAHTLLEGKLYLRPSPFE